MQKDTAALLRVKGNKFIKYNFIKNYLIYYNPIGIIIQIYKLSYNYQSEYINNVYLMTRNGRGENLFSMSLTRAYKSLPLREITPRENFSGERTFVRRDRCVNNARRERAVARVRPGPPVTTRVGSTYVRL